MCSSKLFQRATMDDTRAFPKWNAAIVNVIEYTYTFPTMIYQNVCCEKVYYLRKNKD